MEKMEKLYLYHHLLKSFKLFRTLEKMEGKLSSFCDIRKTQRQNLTKGRRLKTVSLMNVDMKIWLVDEKVIMLK